MLSELRHVNLVSLLGFCVEQQEKILVYEYMPCGTLADHLFKFAQKSRDYNPLSWKQRLKICIGAGRALDYLHTGHGIIHRDVKSSNILLDDKFVAKFSDFGLAKTGFGSESQIQNSTLVKGTPGYWDPYYRETKKLTKYSDTYSFGVVLLEVLCGRRALERHSEEDKCRLTTWAIDNISKGQVDHIVFPSLKGEISPESLETFVKVAKKCLHDEPKKRPAIARVVMELELALKHQEKTKSLDPNERSSVEDLFSSTVENQRENMNFMAPNEKINIVDTLPQMEYAKSAGQNEIRNVTDAMPCTHNDRTTILSVGSIPMISSSNAQTVTSLPIEQINSTVINSGRKGGRKSMMLRISQKLWPWKTRKPSNKTDLVGTSISAPIPRRTSNISMDDNSIKNNRSGGMVLTPAAESSNEKEEPSRTMYNISKGQVDHIVAPTLGGEISPDSLRTFVNNAGRWLHDEPKNRPITLNFVTKIELALEQQEKAEPLPLKDRTSVEGVSSSAGTSQKKNMNFMAPDEKINVTDDASPSSAGQILPLPNLKVFSFAELKAATRNFKRDSVLGVGGFGTVYKGWLDERASGKTTVIAVKKLNSESTQGFEEWQSEVNFLGALSHPNLVKLLGYGCEEKELLLVYEFMPKGSLDNHLFGRGASVQPLPWDIRLKILIGAARGLAFLHSLERKVIYRDFKASNILLGGSYEAKLSDFGLAKLGPTASESHVSTRIMGTHGYAAPEYIATGHLYVKSDVYGFGVVSVEMLTGLRALDTRRPTGQQNLVDWIKPHLSNRRKLKHIIDVRLEGRYPTRSALQVAQLALTCLESEPRKRPSMQEIVETLERLIDCANHRPTQRRVHFSQRRVHFSP